MASRGDNSYEIINWITKDNKGVLFEVAERYQIPLNDLSNDKSISEYLLTNNLTRFKLPIKDLIGGVLDYYKENKDQIDQQVSQSLDFKYNVIDSFENSGNKIP